MSTICDIYRNAISLGHYNADEMTAKIETMYASDRITAEERVELLRLCDDHADDRYQIDVVAKLAELDERIAKIDGLVILASIGGAVTHRVEKDENGKIILVPVEEG